MPNLMQYNVFPGRTLLPANAYYSTLGRQKMQYVSPRRVALLLDCCAVRTPIRHAHVMPQGLTPQGVPNWTPAFGVSQSEAPLMPPSVQKKWPGFGSRNCDFTCHMRCSQLWGISTGGEAGWQGPLLLHVDSQDDYTKM